ncbi:MAG: response regulator [Anaerolineae bacterium]
MPGQTTQPIIDDALAEGSLRPVEPEDQMEAVGLQGQPHVVQAIEPPSADTGVMPAVGAAEAVDDDEQQDAHEQTDAARSVGSEPLARVLIVEDTVELAELVVITLKRAHISAEYEARGERAFARYVERKPSVLLLDLNLPDMTGWKVLEAIKNHARQTGTPIPRIIVMTAMGDPANRLVGKLQGVFSYIVKPFTPAEMQAAVQNALDAGG